ncbi:MAG TPA: anaerobic ribonucleoside triphosphate reductase, partial [Paenibacillus sp.]
VAKSFAKKFKIGLNYFSEISFGRQEITLGNLTLINFHPRSFSLAMQEVQTECLQAVENSIHNLNIMSSRSGVQILH